MIATNKMITACRAIQPKRQSPKLGKFTALSYLSPYEYGCLTLEDFMSKSVKMSTLEALTTRKRGEYGFRGVITRSVAIYTLGENPRTS